ncbi:MAG: nuclear transport factor 2 family protein [Bacteroidota bacterium]
MIKKMFFIASLLFTSLFVSAQSGASKKVAEAIEAFKLAMISGDSAALSALTTSDLSYGHSAGKIDYKAQFIRAFASGSSDFVTIDLTDQTISVHKKAAIVRHQLKATTNDNGKPGNVNIAVMTVWVKQKGKWVLAARQAVKKA